MQVSEVLIFVAAFFRRHLTTGKQSPDHSPVAA
jgi:hypothetical protein